MRINFTSTNVENDRKVKIEGAKICAKRKYLHSVNIV